MPTADGDVDTINAAAACTTIRTAASATAGATTTTTTVRAAASTTAGATAIHNHSVHYGPTILNKQNYLNILYRLFYYTCI